jgi:hypothetical protein|tara:strand:- start:1421 stop:1942 length:522 start_codon:yes stop_codon:yes gene_type:complete
MNETTQKKPIKKTKKQVKNVGRPKIILNLEELERLSRLNCTMPEISAYFDIPLRTLEDKFANELDVRKAIEKGRATGKLSLRRRQIQIMEETNNPTMAIWLGKQLLGQTDKQEIIQEINIEDRKVLDISRLTDDDLNNLERTLKYALVDESESGEDAKVAQTIHQRSMGNNRT